MRKLDKKDVGWKVLVTKFLRRTKNVVELNKMSKKEILRIPWDDVIFGKGTVRIETGANSRNKSIKTYQDWYTLKNVKESMSSLKHYFEALRGVAKFIILNNEIQSESPFFHSLRSHIDYLIKAGQYHIENIQKPGSRKISTETSLFINFNNTSSEEQRNLIYQNIKSQYLKQLVNFQKPDKKILYVEERNGYSVKDSFLFTVICNNNKERIIWESSESKKACHVFDGGAVNEAKLKRYISGSGTCKREILWMNYEKSKELKSDLKFVCSIKHNSLEQYSNYLRLIIEAR